MKHNGGGHCNRDISVGMLEKSQNEISQGGSITPGHTVW